MVEKGSGNISSRSAASWPGCVSTALPSPLDPDSGQVGLDRRRRGPWGRRRDVVIPRALLLGGGGALGPGGRGGRRGAPLPPTCAPGQVFSLRREVLLLSCFVTSTWTHVVIFGGLVGLVVVGWWNEQPPGTKAGHEPPNKVILGGIPSSLHLYNAKG
jgi:hypothetical protein